MQPSRAAAKQRRHLQRADREGEGSAPLHIRETSGRADGARLDGAAHPGLTRLGWRSLPPTITIAVEIATNLLRISNDLCGTGTPACAGEGSCSTAGCANAEC